MTDLQRIYEDTIHAIVNHPVCVSRYPFDEPVWVCTSLKLYLIFAFDNTYYYHLGEDKYAIQKYL